MPNEKDHVRLVTVASFDYPYQAHLAAARLKDAGIPAIVTDEFLFGMRMFMSKTSSGVKIKVEEGKAEEARDLLAQEDFTQAADEGGEEGE